MYIFNTYTPYVRVVPGRYQYEARSGINILFSNVCNSQIFYFYKINMKRSLEMANSLSEKKSYMHLTNLKSTNGFKSLIEIENTNSIQSIGRCNFDDETAPHEVKHINRKLFNVDSSWNLHRLPKKLRFQIHRNGVNIYESILNFQNHDILVLPKHSALTMHTKKKFQSLDNLIKYEIMILSQQQRDISLEQRKIALDAESMINRSLVPPTDESMSNISYNNTYTCKDCDRKFIYYGSYLKHIQKCQQ